jgi:thioester reductase-like protein
MSLEGIASPGDCILVTGSSGFIGSKVVEILLEYGFVNLRCFVRSSNRLAASRMRSADSKPRKTLSW